MATRRTLTLYSNNGPAAVLAVIFALLLMAAFAAGIVALYIIKFNKPKVEDTTVGKALMHSFGIASAATAAIYVGSLAGGVFFGAFRYVKDYEVQLFVKYAIPFFFEVALTIFLANRLIVSGYFTGRRQRLAVPLVAFFVYTIINVVWKYGLYALQSPLEAMVAVINYGIAQIALPFRLVYHSFATGDFAFALKWFFGRIADTQGNQFQLAELFPALFFVVLLTGVATLTIGAIRGVADTSVD